MKHFLFTSLLSLMTICCYAQNNALTAMTYDAKYTMNSEKNLNHTIGDPSDNMMARQRGVSVAATVYFKFMIADPARIKASDKVILLVNSLDGAGKESYAWQQEIPIRSKKKANEFVNLYSDFKPGNYVVKILDADNDKDIYYTGKFTVTGTGISNATSNGMPDYKHNSTLVLCRKVDDSWNAVGETKAIRKGECFQLLYKAKDIMHMDGFVMWVFFKVKEGNQLEYANDLQMPVSNEGNKGYRFLATDDICGSLQPGKYNAYLVEKIEWDTHHGDVEGCNYYGKTSFTVN